MALMVLIFITSACGQTSTSSEENADDAPPANVPEENAPVEDQGEDQADDQGEDQADDQDDSQGEDQDDSQGDGQADDQDDAGSDDQAEDQGDDS